MRAAAYSFVPYGGVQYRLAPATGKKEQIEV